LGNRWQFGWRKLQRLVDALLDEGFEAITVLDLSNEALEKSNLRLGGRSATVQWVVADVTSWEPPQAYDLWHDRATFHFLTDPKGPPSTFNSAAFEGWGKTRRWHAATSHRRHTLSFDRWLIGRGGAAISRRSMSASNAAIPMARPSRRSRPMTFATVSKSLARGLLPKLLSLPLD
jgi:hypothetical protein